MKAPSYSPRIISLPFFSTLKSHWSGLCCLVILLFASIPAQGQNTGTADWRAMGNNKDADFYEVQQAFYDYWEGKTPSKGQSFKVFKRWENYVEPRVYPSGDLSLPSTTLDNFLKWEEKYGTPEQRSVMMTSNWTALGPLTVPTGYDAASGRVDFVRFHPTDPNTMWVGTPDGGLWKTTNGGTSWTTNTDFLTVIGCSDIVIDPSNPMVMYLATGNWENDRRSAGVLKTTDGGATWNTTSLVWTPQDNYKIRRMVMHPSNPDIMMIATDGGVFRTTDGWASFSNPYCCNTLYDLEFKPGDPNTVYAVGRDFWKSTDNGASWTQITTGLPVSTDVSRMVMAVSPANAAYVYLIAGNTDHGFLGLYRSTDSGTSFSTRSTTPNILKDTKDGTGTGGQAGHDLAVVVSPSNADLVTIGGVNGWQSTDGGINWTLVAYWLGNDPAYPGEGDSSPDYVHADIQDLQYLPGSSTTLFATCDGGIYKSTNNGANWTGISSNLSVAQQTAIALSASDANLLVAGLQDIGTLKKSGSTWSGINGGDGEDAFIHRTDNNIIVTSNPNGAFDISFDGGMTRTAVLGLPTGEWYSPISQDPVTASTVYVGGRPELYRKTDLFTNNDGVWEILGTPSGTGNILRFVVAPSNNTIIYAIKADAVSKSTDSGTNWTDVTGTLPLGSAMPTSIAVSNADPNKVWVTFSGYSVGNKVFKTTDGGSTWTNISTGLPNLPINTVVTVNGSTNDAVYIGADIGVYYLDNSLGGTWEAFFTDLPRCAVTDLEIFYPTNKLRASTYGRGAWEADIKCIPNLVIVSMPIPGGLYRSQGDLTSHDSSVANGSTVTFASDTGVLLTMDFEVLMGGVFEILIQTCP